MISPIVPLMRPSRIVYRFFSGSQELRLPFPGVWSFTHIGGGGGSGATHSGYGAPSERGSNGSLGNHPSVPYWPYKSGVIQVSIGVAGAGGTLTNNTDIPAQRGKSGESTSFFSTRNGGTGGRCAYEANGLNPTAPAANYPTGYDNRSVQSGTYLGVSHHGGSVNNSAGRGAAGSSTPGQAGKSGNNGRADCYYFG